METQTMTTPATLNGLDIQAAQGTIAAVGADSTLGKFQFRVRNRWLGGTRNVSTVKDFYGAGREDTSRSQPFLYLHDEPPVLLGTNEGANPGESLLHALAGCIATTLILHATARGIVVHELSSEVRGDADVRGALGLDEAVPPEFVKIRVALDVKADCTDEALGALIDYTLDHSPVSNTIRRPVPIVVERVDHPIGGDLRAAS